MEPMPWRKIIRQNQGTMADLLGSGSKQLADMLKDWNNVLQHSSLGKKPSNANEPQDGDAPSASRPAGARRRQMA